MSRRGLRVAVIGAGISGVAMAVHLQRAGFANFTVFERSDGPGGTWRDNTYPECAVDVPSHAYSFPFMSYDWSRNYATQPELLCYIEDTIDRFGVRSHFRFGVTVESARWDNSRSAFDLRLEGGELEEFDVVVSCLGLLNNPKLPEWPGLEDFAGPAFHTSRWEHEHDLAGKRVAVVGTGSTSAQVVAGLAPVVGELLVFQRSPGWVLPKNEKIYSAKERARFVRFPFLQARERNKRIRSNDSEDHHRALRVAESAESAALRDLALKYIDSAIEDPEVRAMVTPDYPMGCKRPVLTATYYPAFNRPTVRLIPQAVTRVTATGLVDATGIEHPVDVLVMATGFTPQNMLASLEVYGHGGVSIHEAWAGSPKAFHGMTVPGFPNFFMLYGPNTNGGISVMMNSDRQAQAVVRQLRRLDRSGAATIETSKAAFEEYVRWVDEGNLTRTSSLPQYCTNYYYAPDGRNVTQFPDTDHRFKTNLRRAFPLGLSLEGRRRTPSRPRTHERV